MADKAARNHLDALWQAAEGVREHRTAVRAAEDAALAAIRQRRTSVVLDDARAELIPLGLPDAELAADFGTSPFALLRAFKPAYGLPPHAWLTGERVKEARRLLDEGVAPATAATTVGFTDQSHLNRHFTRIVGVPPGAYQRERKNVQDPLPEPS